jgi:hypothetical protein
MAKQQLKKTEVTAEEADARAREVEQQMTDDERVLAHRQSHRPRSLDWRPAGQAHPRRRQEYERWLYARYPAARRPSDTKLRRQFGRHESRLSAG